ncbi:PREDICTED: uncharacterized protein LOC108764900 [Trachymyrmex cornetzi]|uniref:uncharacterized protein LOC108764900 n=1 Tax=Trachymyrmex cornetzi TaxID=471704 RepID=UPI00084F2196|nr:PREDICTED: uncharacterized protein LOC108764900 [Trachymyrmex cornetzi]
MLCSTHWHPRSHFEISMWMILSGADTIEEVARMKKELILLLREGKFELRKWSSNEPSLRDDQQEHLSREFNLSTDKSSETRALGLTWDCSSDSFKFSNISHLSALEKPTKRSILARIALIFDPLGLLGPITVVAKIIMQEL